MKYVLALIAALTLAGSALAQHGHSDKGPNGGPMEDVAGVHAELITSGNTITLNIFDETNKPVATKGFTASVLVVRGSERETLTLVPAAESTLTATAKKAVGTGATVTVTLKTAAGKSGQARYKL